MARAKRVIFVAQDEGSAKALAPIIRNLPGRARVDQTVVAGIHAARAFRRNGLDYREAGSCLSAEIFSPEPDLVVTGASMRASIEKDAISFARQAGIPSLTILDSPTWLWWRFTVDGAMNSAALPDHILVPDPACKEHMIADHFPAQRLEVTGNPHFDTLLTRAASQGHDLARTVLVVTQPRYEDGIYQSDLSWLKTVLAVCRRLDPDLAPTIRPHSKEDPRRFASLLPPGSNAEADSDILDLILSHQVIIGKNSSALFEAALMGKRVISFARRKSELLKSPIAERDLFHPAMKIDELQRLIGEGIKRRVSRSLPRDIPYYTDGRNSERAIDFITKLLNQGWE